MHQRRPKGRPYALLLIGTLTLVGCKAVSVSGSADTPPTAITLGPMEDRALVSCHELGGGYEYERRAGGVIGLGVRVPAKDDDARAAALQAREANGWTEELYDMLSNVGRDYDQATGFSGTREEFDELSRRATALLERMPPCSQS